MSISFKNRVRIAIIKGAMDYKNIFLDYEYLIFSENFKTKPYYILNGLVTNYLHLTGVNTILSTYDFFNLCLDGKITEDDFNFIKPKKSEKSVIGSVRQKIQALSLMPLIFSSALIAEENLIKNTISCSLATTDNKLTIGFANDNDAKPKTLLLGNELNKSKTVSISLIIRRKRGNKVFDTILQGNIEPILCSIYKSASIS